MVNVWIVTTNSQISALVETGRRLGGSVSVVRVGSGHGGRVDAQVNIALPAGAPAEAAAPAVAAAVNAQPGDVVLVANRAAERVLAGAVAAKLGAPVLTGVVGFGDGGFEVTRFGGIAKETLTSDAAVVVVMAGGNEVDGDADEVTTVAGAEFLEAKVTAENISHVEAVDLASAKRIVSAGRGFKAEGDLQLVRDLAAALGAEVSCSRPLAEGVGWMSKDSYVGVSGQTVKPDIYLAVGISGQLQHLAGAQEAKTIIAINSDDKAPIFAHADYGVVGDLYQVLPALTDALK